MKDYQTSLASAAMTELEMPTTVSIAMNGLTGAVREGLLTLAVGAGLQVMQVMMEQNVTAVCGPKDRRVPDRTAVRHGTEDGAVVLGGRKVKVRRPRVDR